MTRGVALAATGLVRASHVLASVELAIASGALVAGLVIPVYSVAMRIAGVPTGEWVLDVPTELLVVAAIYGSGALLGQQRHMKVDVLASRLTGRAGALLDLAVQVLVAALAALLTVRAIESVGQVARAGLRYHDVFNIPVAYFSAIAAAGFAGWTFHGLATLVERLMPGSALRPRGPQPAVGDATP